MGDLYACTDCNVVYWHPNVQNECYVCGNDSFVEVSSGE